jgi:hypothetical protein
MSRLSFSGIAALAAILVGGCSAASAASVAECQHYARSAVNQYTVNRSIPGCFLGDDARWHPDAETHRRWCLAADDASIWNETAYRARALRGCQARAGY